LLRGSRLLYAVVATTFLFILGSAVSDPVRPLFITQVGATALQLGFIMALPSLVSVLTRVPASALADRLGRWRLVLMSLVLSVGVTAAFALVNDPVWFYPVVSLSALAWSVFSPITLVVVSERSTPATRGVFIGMYFTAIGAALLGGPLLCSLFAFFLGLRQLLLVCTAFPLLALTVYLLFLRRGDMEHYRGFDESVAETKVGSWASLARIFRVRNVIGLCAARVSFAFSMGVFSTLFSVYAEGALGFTPSLIALLFSVRGLTNVLIRMPAGQLSDRIGRRKPFILAYGINVLVFALLAYVEAVPLLMLTMALYGVGWGMRIAPSTALLSESVAPEDGPLAMATFMTMWDVGYSVGALLAGFTAAFISTPMMMLICSPIVFSALVVFILLSTETL